MIETFTKFSSHGVENTRHTLLKLAVKTLFEAGVF